LGNFKFRFITSLRSIHLSFREAVNETMRFGIFL